MALTKEAYEQSWFEGKVQSEWDELFGWASHPLEIRPSLPSGVQT